MNLIPQKTGHKLDKQDNEKMWDFEDIYRSNRLYLAIWEMAHKWLNWLMNDSRPHFS